MRHRLGGSESLNDQEHCPPFDDTMRYTEPLEVAQLPKQIYQFHLGVQFTMKTIVKLAIALGVVAVISAALVAAGSPEPEFERSYAGRYLGYSWRGEAGGTAFEDASQYIKTVLELDDDGIITDARIWFFVQRDGFWIPRRSGNAYVAVEFEVDPTPATSRIDDYEDGDSMFTVHTADLMSFYAAAVDSDGTVAAALVCPVTRYIFEMKFASDYDFSREFGELTIGSGEIVPTHLTSGAPLVRPQEWNELADKHFLNIHYWSHVANDVGVLGDITASSSVQALLEALGVSFSGGEPQPLDPSYG